MLAATAGSTPVSITSAQRARGEVPPGSENPTQALVQVPRPDDVDAVTHHLPQDGYICVPANAGYADVIPGSLRSLWFARLLWGETLGMRHAGC